MILFFLGSDLTNDITLPVKMRTKLKIGRYRTNEIPASKLLKILASAIFNC